MTAAIATLLALALQLADPARLETGGPTLHVTIDARPQPSWAPAASGPRWYRFESRSRADAAPRDFLYVERLTAIDLTYAVVHGAGIGPATWSAIVALSPADFAPPAPDTIAARAVTTAVARAESGADSMVTAPAPKHDDAIPDAPDLPGSVADDPATSAGFVYRLTTDGITVADPSAAVVLTLRYARGRR